MGDNLSGTPIIKLKCGVTEPLSKGFLLCKPLGPQIKAGIWTQNSSWGNLLGIGPGVEAGPGSFSLITIENVLEDNIWEQLFVQGSISLLESGRFVCSMGVASSGCSGPSQ